MGFVLFYDLREREEKREKRKEKEFLTKREKRAEENGGPWI